MGVEYVMVFDIRAGVRLHPVDCFFMDFMHRWGRHFKCNVLRQNPGCPAARPVRVIEHLPSSRASGPGTVWRCTGIEDPRAPRPWCSWFCAFLTGADPADPLTAAGRVPVQSDRAMPPACARARAPANPTGTTR